MTATLATDRISGNGHINNEKETSIMAKKAAKKSTKEEIPDGMKSKAAVIREVAAALGKVPKKERNGKIIEAIKEKHPHVDLGANPAAAINQALKGKKGKPGRKPGRKPGVSVPVMRASGMAPAANGAADSADKVLGNLLSSGRISIQDIVTSLHRE